MVKDVTGKRQLCWDTADTQHMDGIRVQMHRPEKKNIVLKCDAPWEGVDCSYMSVLKVGGKYHLYYRGCSIETDDERITRYVKGRVCLAVSEDGIRYTKPSLGLYEVDGTYENNVVFTEERDIDNFSVFEDENPDCPESEKYKALSKYDKDGKPRLALYVSGDSIRFSFREFLPVEGAFDSFNVLFWDRVTRKYHLYIRNFHNSVSKMTVDSSKELLNPETVRDIRLCLSDDCRNWTEPKLVTYTDPHELQLYTNQICRYYRSDDFYLGMPVRYIDRAADESVLAQMPHYDKRRQVMKHTEKRSGTAMTDCIVMTSRDGLVFDRCNEAFLTPGIESDEYGWNYGDCYTSYGFIETPSALKDAPQEISFYCNEHYRVSPIEIRRYTQRLDGFFSFHADFSGGSLLTKPFVMDADTLELNMETSALGYVKVTLCGGDGTPIEGYTSCGLFGNATKRTVNFEKDLRLLRGRTLTMRVKMRDAELYSYLFRSQNNCR